MAIKAFLGLGNPGKEYEKTYHSVGIWAQAKLQSFNKDDAGRVIEVARLQKDVYMNQSSILSAAVLQNKPYGIDSLLVIHDDSDLPIGVYKLVFGGGSAGHKGVQDIIDKQGTQDFWRLRIGVRDPKETTRKKAEEFVLQKWSSDDEEMFEQVIARAWTELKTKNLI